mmetsp:Transcript_114147/g.333696  ORF Transcript_114147/g.333696 Transcript_114147/m.333696 type:complete len:791 (-) Transcript_114147:79-2451(-)
MKTALALLLLTAHALGAEASRWHLRRKQGGPEALLKELEEWAATPWKEWHEHTHVRFVAFLVVALSILVLMAATLAVMELIIHLKRRMQVQYLEELNEKEIADLADLSRTKDGTSPSSWNRAAEKHRVHGSDSEDVWSFVNGDESRLKTLVELPDDARALEDRVAAAAKALHIKSGPDEVEQISKGLKEIRELVRAPDFQQEIQEHLHDDHIHTIAGCLAETTDEKYQDGERHAHKEFKDMRLKASGFQAYFASERWMDHMAISFVFVYTQICGLIYAWYLHELMEPENKSVLSPNATPLEPRILLARAQAMALIITTCLMVALLTRGVCTKLRALVGWSTVLQAMIDKHVLVHRSCGYMIVFASFVHCGGHLLQTALNIHRGAKLVYDFTGWPATTGYILWAVLLAFCGLSSNYVRRKAFEWFFYPHLVLIALWTVFLILHGGTQWFGFGVPLACVSVLPVVVVYFVERIRHVRRGTDETIHIADATVRENLVMVTIDLGKSSLSYRTGQYSMLKVPEIAQHEWHPFTIASGGGQQQFDLLIAVAGDWTSKFRDMLQSAQEKHKALPASQKMPDSRPAYPTICVRGGYGAPAEGMKGKDHIVMVGGGVGATPFLSFLSAACNAVEMDGGGAFPGLKSAVFFWVSRNPEDFKWVNKYSQIIAANPSLADRIEIRLCLTKTLESSATEDVSETELSLFWLGVQRATRRRRESGELAAMLGVPTQFGRPDWEQELAHVSAELRKARKKDEDHKRFEISVFACGNPMLTKSLEDACAANTNRKVVMRLYAEEF